MGVTSLCDETSSHCRLDFRCAATVCVAFALTPELWSYNFTALVRSVGHAFNLSVVAGPFVHDVQATRTLLLGSERGDCDPGISVAARLTTRRVRLRDCDNCPGTLWW